MSLLLAADGAGSTVPSPLYRAVWRWHFYAGLLVIPFLLNLAVTGGLYLFKDELNDLIYGRYLHVTAQSTAPLAPSALVDVAVKAVPGKVASYLPPSDARASATVSIATERDGKIRVYVNPYSGDILGHLADGGSSQTPIMLLIKKIHSLDYFGWFANRLIELAAGWSIVLVVSGIYLWWPRNKDVGVFKIRQGARKRPFWRDLHAVTGLYTAAFILFLAVTGLPWSGFWGAKLNTYADANGVGYPPQFWNDVPVSTVPMKDAMTQTSWSLENVPMPESTPVGAASIGLDKAVAIFNQSGIHAGYMIDFPSGETGVYSASVFPDDVAFERIIHLDQYSGQILFDGGFRELGPVGKTIEWGISVHQGQEFGRINQLLMLGAVLSIIAMCVSGIVMWWKRRPKGSLGAPRYPSDYRVARGAIAILALLGILFPLVGLSILLALAIDFMRPRALGTAST